MPQLEELEHEKSLLNDEIDRLTQVRWYWGPAEEPCNTPSSFPGSLSLVRAVEGCMVVFPMVWVQRARSHEYQNTKKSGFPALDPLFGRNRSLLVIPSLLPRAVSERLAVFPMAQLLLSPQALLRAIG